MIVVVEVNLKTSSDYVFRVIRLLPGMEEFDRMRAEYPFSLSPLRVVPHKNIEDIGDFLKKWERCKVREEDYWYFAYPAFRDAILSETWEGGEE